MPVDRAKLKNMLIEHWTQVSFVIVIALNSEFDPFHSGELDSPLWLGKDLIRHFEAFGQKAIVRNNPVCYQISSLCFHSNVISNRC